MNITFLIGNGFDVGMGMKSRFSDFFPKYCADSVDKEESLRGLSKDIEEHQDDWSYFELQIGQYTNNFTPQNKQVFLNQFRDFELSFIDYLKDEEALLSFSETKKIADVMISGLTKYYNTENLQVGSSQQVNSVYSNRLLENHTINFVTFNYSAVLEKCLKTIPDGVISTRKTSNGNYYTKIGRVVHVHGTNDALPIMGVNDASQIANKELANDKRFIRYLVKPLSNEVHRMNHDKESAELIGNSHIICIYGMSLGETDKDWWNRVLIWLNANSSRQLVVFVYDKDFRMSTHLDWIEKEDAIIDRLAEFTNFDIENLRPRIHIAVQKNIFEMNLRRHPEEEKLIKELFGIPNSDEDEMFAKFVDAYVAANKEFSGSM